MSHVGTSRRAGMLVMVAIVLAVFALVSTTPISGQGRGGGQGRGQGPGQAPAAPLPDAPTAVALPTLSSEVIGPGPMFDSAPSHVPDRGPAHFRYDTREYWISGTANGQPYRTRMVVRRPADNARFSGLVLMEAMHPSGAAHMFEFSAIYTMSSGHAAVEVVVHPQAVAQFTTLNGPRYRDFQLSPGQASEILAQAGSLVRSARGPLTGLTVRRMVLGGTSATAGTLIGYLPAHMVYRTPEMERIYDGFLPTSTADVQPRVDVPMIHVPTMNEIITPNISRRQDGDEEDNRFRQYEFAGMVHIDTRDNVRLHPNPCAQPLSRFPMQAYMSVALHHLLEWVDKGTVPPKAERIWTTRVVGSMLAVDERGNPRGGIRNPYVDVPVAKYAPVNTPADPPIPNASPLFTPILCGLGGYEQAFTPETLRGMYGSPQKYVRQVEQRLTELERAGWSLPVYRHRRLPTVPVVHQPELASRPDRRLRESSALPRCPVARCQPAERRCATRSPAPRGVVGTPLRQPADDDLARSRTRCDRFEPRSTPAGNPRLTTLRPDGRRARSTIVSWRSPWPSSPVMMASKVYRSLAANGAATPGRLAAAGMVVPCASTDSSTTKKTTLKIVSASECPPRRGRSPG
jgi:hypothetical protein